MRQERALRESEKISGRTTKKMEQTDKTALLSQMTMRDTSGMGYQTAENMTPQKKSQTSWRYTTMSTQATLSIAQSGTCLPILRDREQVT